MAGDDLPSLDRLSRQIGEAQEKHAPPPEAEPSPAAKVMQMGTEFAAGVLVGCVVGYFLDRWLGTTPVFLMVCLALGGAAGFRTMLRSAGGNTEKK